MLRRTSRPYALSSEYDNRDEGLRSSVASLNAGNKYSAQAHLEYEQPQGRVEHAELFARLFIGVAAFAPRRSGRDSRTLPDFVKSFRLPLMAFTSAI